MKKFLNIEKTTITMLIILIINSCNKELSFPSASFIGLSGALMAPDHTVYNHDQMGKFVYTQIKYYSGTLDPFSFLPKNKQAAFKGKYNAYLQRTSAWTYPQIVDDLVSQNTYTANQGEILKSDHQSLLDFLDTHPTSTALMQWYHRKEDAVAENTSLSPSEREELLYNKAITKYAIKWKVEQNELNQLANSQTLPKDGRVEQDCSFWSVLACWVGQLANGGGLGNNVGELVASTAAGGEVGAAIGIVVSAINAVEICGCSINKNVCQAPVSVSFPYQCYTYGTPLYCQAVGYGNITPTQFSYGFYPNDNTSYANEMWQYPSGSNGIYIPASYMTSSVHDLAVQVGVLCSGVWTQSAYFGWYYPADLGKPFFSITGNGNISLSQTGSGWYYSYQVAGPISDTINPTTVTWQVIPSGYPNYSATGTIVSGSNTGNSITVQWDSNAGFANLQCTASNSCATIVQYFTIHVQ